jgi:hypothetical protein
MTPAAIIREAAADGVSLALSPAGTIKATGDQAAVTRWLQFLREYKPAILAALAHPGPLPRLPRGLGGYGTPPGVPPLGDSELARQVRSMSEDGQPEPLWWRVSITDPGGRTVEVDTPSGWTLSEWAAYTLRYYGPGCAVTAIAGLPKPTGTGQPR